MDSRKRWHGSARLRARACALGPKICQAISVQHLADELAEKHGEALSKQLSTTLLARLLE